MPLLRHAKLIQGWSLTFLFAIAAVGCAAEPEPTGIALRDLQNRAVYDGRAEFGYWGVDPNNYKGWASHSNRLIPVYTFGTANSKNGSSLEAYQGANSPYRSAEALKRLYGRVPSDTLNPQAVYCDQTNVYDLQKAALDAGRKHIFLVIFDGMDWQTTQLASLVKNRKETYKSGRGTGLHFLDYTAGGTTEYGYFVTAPHNAGTNVDVDTQTVKNPGGTMPGGFNPACAGEFPWSVAPDIGYPISQPKDKAHLHAYTDSSCSASSMTAGIKTYNNAVNVDFDGNPVATIAHLAQEQGYLVGAVSSVPISHATPAAAYAHNVHRDDYQDLTRDLLGLKSISHPEQPLSGLDLLIGGGFGDERTKDKGGGKNFVPGNSYLTADDLQAIDVKHGGKYVTSVRQSGVKGGEALRKAAEKANQQGSRLFGFYGVGKYKGHLPFRTASDDYQPALGRANKAEVYSEADLAENPTLAEMTQAALAYLKGREQTWLMVEAGDVDWANHDNNIDNSIGAVVSGDEAVKVITDWVEANSNWEESLLIVTADHGHYFHLRAPELLLKPVKVANKK